MQHGCEEEGEEEDEEEGRKKEGKAEVALPTFLRDEFVGRLARLSSKLGDGRPTLFQRFPFPTILITACPSCRESIRH